MFDGEIVRQGNLIYLQLAYRKALYTKLQKLTVQQECEVNWWLQS